MNKIDLQFSRSNSWVRRFNHTASLAASLAAMISALVVDKATNVCNLFVHETAPPAYNATTPLVERRVLTSPAKSISLYIFRPSCR